MKCYYHPDLDSAQSCSVCSRFLCEACSHRVKGRVFCQDCLVQGAEMAGVARSPALANYSPSRAALFGIIPGVGAVYNQQYSKAIAHIGIFASLWIIAGSGPVVIGLVAVPAFWIYTMVDAYRSAELIVRRRLTQPESERGEDEQIKLPLWGSGLILLGLLFFLNNLELISLRDAAHFGWPLIFIAAGIYLILHYFFRGNEELSPNPSRSGALAQPPPSPGQRADSSPAEAAADPQRSGDR